MEIKESYIEVKRSIDFQTITLGRLLSIDEGEDVSLIEKQQYNELVADAEDMLDDLRGVNAESKQKEQENKSDEIVEAIDDDLMV